MIYILNSLLNKLYIYTIKAEGKVKDDKEVKTNNLRKKSKLKWLLKLLPLFLITLFVTGVMSLLQSILPIDLVNGGIVRAPFIEQRVATLVTIKLIFLAIFQWPVGYILRNKNSPLKFRLCLVSLLIGFIFLSLSNFFIDGYILILISFIPLTIALCIFLPSAADSIIRSSPIKYRGSAIALYSQCFGVSALTIPWMAGKLIDNYNTAFQLWLIISLLCIILLPFCKNIK